MAKFTFRKAPQVLATSQMTKVYRNGILLGYVFRNKAGQWGGEAIGNAYHTISEPTREDAAEMVDYFYTRAERES